MVAEAQVDRAEAAGSWQAARERRRVVNVLRRHLRPAPADGGAAVVEAIRNSQINRIVSWAEAQSGGAR